jgi:hypothetical protein
MCNRIWRPAKTACERGEEHGKLNALHQAEWAGKFAEQELRGKGGRQNQRNAIEAQRVERDGKTSSHVCGLK